MDVYVLDQQFRNVAVLDTYQSFIWTERYNTYGDFEIYISVDSPVVPYLTLGSYLVRRDTDVTMRIEKIQLNTNVTEGNMLVISGRSLESILDQRVIASMIYWPIGSDNTLQGLIKQLLTENISPLALDFNRRILNFAYEPSTDAFIAGLTIDTESQYLGENLYEVISELCKSVGIGFKVVLNTPIHKNYDEHYYNQFVFQLYNGQDRSYAQIANPYVVFSPKYDNLINSVYELNDMESRNSAVIEGEDHFMATYGDLQGIHRKEIYVDSMSLSRTYEKYHAAQKGTPTPVQFDYWDGTGEDPTGGFGDWIVGTDPTGGYGDTYINYIVPGYTTEATYTDAEYTEVLQNSAKEALTEYSSDPTFEAEADLYTQWQYDRDYSIGDIVQFENEYGIQMRVRIIEFITSDSDTGLEQYPTFEAVT